MLVLKTNQIAENQNLPSFVFNALENRIKAHSPSVWLDFDDAFINEDSGFELLCRATNDIYIPAATLAPQLINGASRSYVKVGAQEGATSNDFGALKQKIKANRLSANGVHTHAFLWKAPAKNSTPVETPSSDGEYVGTILGSETGHFRSAYFRAHKSDLSENGYAFTPRQGNSSFTSFSIFNDPPNDPINTWNATIASWSVSDGKLQVVTNGTLVHEGNYTIPAMGEAENQLVPMIFRSLETDGFWGSAAASIYIPDKTIWQNASMLEDLKNYLDEIKNKL